MKILKIKYIIIICSILFSLTGCSAIQSRLKKLDSEVNSTNKYQVELTQNILNCFSENDKNALKNLLCAKTQGLTDIDEQIQTGFDLIKGKVNSYNEDLMGSESESVEYGKTTLLERSWSVDDIVTDEDEKYEIHINTYVINENDKKKEGISEIIITCSDGTKYQIGYQWPSYYDEGSKLAYNVITAFSENDIDGLKSVLCSKTLDIGDINEQIQSGMEFFEGKATMGKVEGKNIEYNGKHDYTTTVRDDEVVINNEPTRTYITVFNENIETDSGKVYSMKFYAYLLNMDDISYEGISQIVIKSEDGTEQVIGEKLE